MDDGDAIMEGGEGRSVSAGNGGTQHHCCQETGRQAEVSGEEVEERGDGGGRQVVAEVARTG